MAMPDIFDFENYRDYLDAWFTARRAASRNYTHRRFAEEAGQTNVGILALLLGGKRHLTPNLVQAIRKPLGLDEARTEFLALLCQKEDAEQALAAARLRLERASARVEARPTPAARPSFEERRRARTTENAASSALAAVSEAEEALRVVRQELAARRALQRAELMAAQRMRVLSRWSTAALSQLAQCSSFQADPRWAERAFGGRASAEALAEGLALLAELGALPPEDRQPGADGEQVAPWITPDAVQIQDVRAYYEGVFEQAALAMRAQLDAGQPGRALLGGLTVAIPSAHTPQFQALIQDVQRQIFAFLESLEGPRDAVYQLYLHLFPLTELPLPGPAAQDPVRPDPASAPSAAPPER